MLFRSAYTWLRTSMRSMRGNLAWNFFFWSFSFSEGLDFSVGMLIGLVIVRVFYTTPRSLLKLEKHKDQGTWYIYNNGFSRMTVIVLY